MMKDKKNYFGNGISVGLCLGVVFGIILDNLALGIRKKQKMNNNFSLSN